LESTVNGKRIKHSLKTSSLRKAKGLRDKIMKPLEVAAEEEALRAVVQKLEATTETKQVLDEQTNPPLTVAEAWDAYTRSTRHVGRPNRVRDAWSSALGGGRGICSLFLWSASCAEVISSAGDASRGAGTGR
jgi:hypothetical protein